MAQYDNKTKYKIIEEVCNGKTSSDIHREYGIGTSTTIRWLRTFAENGPFKGDKLTPKDYASLEKLQGSAKKRELEMRFHGTTTNESFEWLLEYDPNLTEWKAYAELKGGQKLLRCCSFENSSFLHNFSYKYYTPKIK